MRPLLRYFSLPFLLLLLSLWASLQPQTVYSQSPPLSDTTRSALEAEQSNPDWALVAPHLPNLLTSSPERLELQGDILRARRFPANALVYFRAAIMRGGDPSVLMNKMAVTEMELGENGMARVYVRAALKAQKKNAQAWNNLGAIDFVQKHYRDAIHDYKHAIQCDGQAAVYHSNLGLAYLDIKDFESARTQLMAALKLDPEIFVRHNTAGSSLHILSSSDRGALHMEMAKAYARMGNEVEMLHALESASETGMEIQEEMANDPALAKYVNDPRVVTMVRAAKTLRASRLAQRNVATGVVPALPPAAPAAPPSANPPAAPR
jgi:tetratricopeptide (TPR) repeat protein